MWAIIFFLDALITLLLKPFLKSADILRKGLYLISKLHISTATRTIDRISCEIGDRLYFEKKMAREARAEIRTFAGVPES